MATSLLALLDDIASVLGDVALMTKVAAKKTAGVLGDDLALNAQQLTGVQADRELPVVWAVARGSLLNKAILVPVPVALAISAWAPWLITPLLMKGLSVLGTAAMFLVGGGILTHGLPALDHGVDAMAAQAGTWGPAWLPLLADAVVGVVVGVVVGAAVLALWTGAQGLWLRGRRPA